jgi:hypothetical protein
MRRSIIPALAFCGVFAASIMAFADMSAAQRGPGNVRPSPAPLLGVGLPLAGGALLAIALVRRYRRKG